MWDGHKQQFLVHLLAIFIDNFRVKANVVMQQQKVSSGLSNGPKRCDFE